jgi:hypothetical protein
MKSDKLSNWLTFGANVGVLIGILLLVYELAQNREMIRSQTRNQISQQISARLSMMGGDIQVASVKRRAEVGEELSDDEEAQYFLLFVANMRDWENIHYQYRQGLFDEDEFSAEKRTWKFLNERNMAFSRHWCLTRQNYSLEFVAEIESLLSEHICQPR